MMKRAASRLGPRWTIALSACLLIGSLAPVAQADTQLEVVPGLVEV